MGRTENIKLGRYDGKTDERHTEAYEHYSVDRHFKTYIHLASIQSKTGRRSGDNRLLVKHAVWSVRLQHFEETLHYHPAHAIVFAAFFSIRVPLRNALPIFQVASGHPR